MYCLFIEGSTLNYSLFSYLVTSLIRDVDFCKAQERQVELIKGNSLKVLEFIIETVPEVTEMKVPLLE